MSFVRRAARAPTAARASRALGICARSGRKMLLADMVKDGNTGQMVDPNWSEPKHPQETPVRLSPDEGKIKNPAPNTDNDGGDTATPSDWLDELPGGGYGFGAS